MRAKIFLLKASCILLTTLFICGEAAPLAYCQQVVAGVVSGQPEFMVGLIMDLHEKAAIIEHIIEPYKMAEKATKPMGEKKTPEELINYLIKKNSPAPNKVEAISSGTTSSPQVVEISAATVAEINAEKANNDEYTGIPVIEEVDPIINKYAEMISVEPEDISNYPLYRFIDKWYGTRYKWGGNDLKGIDCSAFSQKLYGEIYGTDLSRTSKQQRRNSTFVKHYIDANEGDLIFFRIHRIRISHVGVYLANGYFVHASRSHGVMISSLNSKYWHRRYAGCGRVAREEHQAMESDFMQ